MTNQRRYLSFGGGVNSVALGLWLIDHGIDAEWVYADHHGDWPETREYVGMISRDVHPVTVLDTGDIYDYYWGYRMIPMRTVRACTRLFKVEPLVRYHRRPCTVHVGIDAGERHRVDRMLAHQEEGETKEFLLADSGIDRTGCEHIIRQHGLPVPPKSGCFFCPHQRVGQIRELRTRHKGLFDRALALERRANEGREHPFYLLGRPLDVVAMDDQPDLFGERDMTPCLCEV